MSGYWKWSHIFIEHYGAMKKFHDVVLEDHVESGVASSGDDELEKFKGGSIGKFLYQPVEF